MGGLSDLEFGPGLEIQRLVLDRFNSPVSFSPSLSDHQFLLVASFGRSTLRLNEDSVSLALQSCIGGVANDFNVVHLSGAMFHFTVSSKAIGLLIYNLKYYKCALFAIFFALWGNGGPNWFKDYALWL
ncbi:unnamed protein product [Urochloa humidicola]